MKKKNITEPMPQIAPGPLLSWFQFSAGRSEDASSRYFFNRIKTQFPSRNPQNGKKIECCIPAALQSGLPQHLKEMKHHCPPPNTLTTDIYFNQNYQLKYYLSLVWKFCLSLLGVEGSPTNAKCPGPPKPKYGPESSLRATIQ